MRILHTADWHLGISLYQHSRKLEQELFLSWLLQTLQNEKIDVLIIAGDVFHYAMPSAQALQMYYHFLASVALQTQVQQVVIIAGNHDSAMHLEAPHAALKALRVHIVGGWDPNASWQRYLCPVRVQEMQAVVVAVPFIHEYHLGVRTTNCLPQEILLQTKAAFQKLYKDLADYAHEKYPDAALIATGHLTCGEDPRALSYDVFDPRYDYIALGHIHHMHRISGSKAWYSGTPITYSIAEDSCASSVLLADVKRNIAKDAYDTHVQSLAAPCSRQLHSLTGSIEEVLQQIAAIPSTALLPPYLYIEVEVEEYQSQVQDLLQKALEQHPISYRPCIVSLKQSQAASAATSAEHDSLQLNKEDPESVFLYCYRQKYKQDPSRQTIEAFQYALSCAKQQESEYPS